MPLTNKELASNATWVAAVTFCECPFCGFLSRELDLDMPRVPCPKCRKSGEPRSLFPDMSSVRLLRMVSYFYARSCEREEERRDELVHDLQRSVGRAFDCATAVRAADEVHRLYAASRDDYDRLLGVIRKQLDLQPAENAGRVFALLAQFSETNEEHQICVLLTAALLETLLGELLVRMHVRAGSGWGAARRDLEQRLRGYDKRKREFGQLAGIGLCEAISGAGVPRFYDDWQVLRELRNRFLHGFPYVIDRMAAENAFELAKNCFGMFAYLQNRLCVGQPEG